MRKTFNFDKTQKFIYTLYRLDIILCLVLILLLIYHFIIGYSGTIIHDRYIERISILSSSVGFFLAALFLLGMNKFKSSFQLSSLFARMNWKSGILHLICSLILILYYINHVGAMQVVLGHIYRDYGYVHLINAVPFFWLFAYFKLIHNSHYKHKKES